jgi:hypothetical protein
LKGNRAEIVRPVSPRLFWEEDNVGFVDGSKVQSEGVEVMKGGEEITLYEVPVQREESRPKTIRPRARVIVHGEEGSSNLVEREGAH